jgi:anti-sigma regulatory factor (Ser/Thr protein kinase)
MHSLDDIFDFIGAFVNTNGIDQASIYTINLAVEELFTNMVKYNPESAYDISIGIDKTANNLVVTLIDTDVEPFDMTQTADVDVTKSLEERKAGGLGIHLIKKMVSRIEYEYSNRQSRITLIKHLEN